MTTVTSTFTASNGTQSETLVHEFNVTAAAGAPTFVGGASDYVYPGVSSIPLPAGCQAGDEVMISGESSASSNAISFAAATQILAPTKVNGTKYLAAYAYTLTATDIANGSIPAACTYSYALGVWRASGGVGVDVVGTVKYITSSAATTVNDVTTTVDHTTLIGIFGKSSATAGDPAPTPFPAGWAQAAYQTSNSYGVQMLYFDDFATAGPTNTPSFGYFPGSLQTILLAIKSL
jgi:hypothetical protein